MIIIQPNPNQSHPIPTYSCEDDLNIEDLFDLINLPMTTNDCQWLPMTTLWLYSESEFLTLSDYNLAIFWIHSGYILATFWLHSDHILTTFWLHSDYILTTFWLHSDYLWLFLTDWLTDKGGGIDITNFWSIVLGDHWYRPKVIVWSCAIILTTFCLHSDYLLTTFWLYLTISDWLTDWVEGGLTSRTNCSRWSLILNDL